MTHPHFAIRAALGLLSACAVCPAQDRVAHLDSYVARAAADWEVPGLAVAVVHDGKVVLAKGYGVRELGTEDAVDVNTLFAIGSTTKAMVAATLGVLADGGKLAWDDPVTKHLPGFRLHDPYVTRAVTIRDLLTHRAGLANADQLWYGTDNTRAEIMARVPLIPPAYSFRDGFVYQNIMYLAAGEVAAAVDGKPWEEVFATRLLAPLGMTRTVPTTSSAQRQQNVARPHDRIDGQVEVIENEIVDAIASAGAAWSSVSDMTRWIRMLLASGKWEDRQVLAQPTARELLRPQTVLDIATMYPYVPMLEPSWQTYGLGWFQLDYGGRAVSFHTGSIDGMSAVVGVIPAESLGVVVLTNLDHAEVRHALMWKVFDVFAGEMEGRDWSAELRAFYGERTRAAERDRREKRGKRIAGTQPSLPLVRYAGTYGHALHGTVEVALEDGRLRLTAGPRLTFELTHWHHDTFNARSDRRWQGEFLVTFAVDAQGEIGHLDAAGHTHVRQRGER